MDSHLLKLSFLSLISALAVFVEALDKCFENVCELDLIFHSDKVRVNEKVEKGTESEKHALFSREE